MVETISTIIQIGNFWLSESILRLLFSCPNTGEDVHRVEALDSYNARYIQEVAGDVRDPLLSNAVLVMGLVT
jgi:hypothetical protein